MYLTISNKIISSSLQNDTVGALRTDLSTVNVDIPPPLVNSPFNKYRGSIAWTEGFEKNLHFLVKDQYPERAMGIFTSGGDAQGSLKLFIL